MPFQLGDSSAASATEEVGTRTLSPNTSVTTTVPEEEPEPTATASPDTHDTNVSTGGGGKQEKEQKTEAEHQVETGTTQKSIFKQTMSVADVVNKIEAFTGSSALCQAMCIAGTQSSNKRGGALSEVALTRREKRQKQLQKSSQEDVPENWDPTSTVAPSQQRPYKKRGRKPKDEKEKASPSVKAAAKKKTKAKAAAKARSTSAKAKAKTVEPAPPKTDKRKKTEETSKAKKGDDKAAEKKKEDTKKRVSRKSAAYHRAFKASKSEGKDLEACKAAAKQVLQLHIYSATLLIACENPNWLLTCFCSLCCGEKSHFNSGIR